MRVRSEATTAPFDEREEQVPRVVSHKCPLGQQCTLSRQQTAFLMGQQR